MAIQSNNFGRVVLSGDDAVQFVNHIKNDKPNPQAQAALKRGRSVLSRLKKSGAIA